MLPFQNISPQRGRKQSRNRQKPQQSLLSKTLPLNGDGNKVALTEEFLSKISFPKHFPSTGTETQGRGGFQFFRLILSKTLPLNGDGNAGNCCIASTCKLSLSKTLPLNGDLRHCFSHFVLVKVITLQEREREPGLPIETRPRGFCACSSGFNHLFMFVL